VLESRGARHLSNAQSDIFDMRQIILALALLYPAAALAQGTSQGATKDAAPPAATSTPPTVGGNPLVQAGKKPAGKKSEAPAKPKSVAQKLQACQEIDDATKERLICYDAIFAPQPKPKPPAAKGVNDCRFVKEEDERLTCYNGFADKIPKLPQ
jgi:hypothetical protein